MAWQRSGCSPQFKTQAVGIAVGPVDMGCVTQAAACVVLLVKANSNSFGVSRPSPRGTNARLGDMFGYAA